MVAVQGYVCLTTFFPYSKSNNSRYVFAVMDQSFIFPVMLFALITLHGILAVRLFFATKLVSFFLQIVSYFSNYLSVVLLPARYGHLST